MRLYLYIAAGQCFFNSTAQCHAEVNAYDPKRFLEERTAFDYNSMVSAHIDIEVLTQVIEGTSYVKFRTKYGSLLVEKVTSSAADTKIYTECESGLAEANSIVSKEHRYKLEAAVSDGVSIDLGFVGQIITEKCSGKIRDFISDYRPLEFGVTIKGRKNRSYRIYNKSLQPNLGFQMDF